MYIGEYALLPAELVALTLNDTYVAPVPPSTELLYVDPLVKFLDAFSEAELPALLKACTGII